MHTVLAHFTTRKKGFWHPSQQNIYLCILFCPQKEREIKRYEKAGVGIGLNTCRRPFSADRVSLTLCDVCVRVCVCVPRARDRRRRQTDGHHTDRPTPHTHAHTNTHTVIHDTKRDLTYSLWPVWVGTRTRKTESVVAPLLPQSLTLKQVTIYSEF